MLTKIFSARIQSVIAAATLMLFAPALLSAQTAASSSSTVSVTASRLTQPIDDNTRITIKGTVHPLAKGTIDGGAAPDSLQLQRMHLVLKRSDAQESALKQLVSDLHTPGTASYHKWLTPEQFGQQFGPSDQDIATVEAWLQSKGFSVTKVNPGKQTIEIAGNVAQLRSAFHTQIHKYLVNGETHYGNATDPQIPAALAPVVGGFVTLNNFKIKSNVKAMGKASFDPKSGKTVPSWTTGDSNGVSFALSPGDYAVQYDLNPLYSAGTDGTGQTIAIVNDSNINIYLVNQFRTLFGLPANPPQVIIDGNDPGIDGINNPDGANGDSGEAYLDVEWSGAVAPKATVDLVVAADTALESGLFLALEHAVYGNIAPVVSLSFGACEVKLGNTNEFLNNLYEQAAAQGQTVLVSTGDSGSAGSDNDNSQYFAYQGQQVSGFASTPYNVAVGGTDFYYSDYNQSASALDAQIATFWNTTPSNNTPTVSIKGVIPEQPWNESQFGLNINSFYTDSGGTETSIAGGSGGASNCAIATYNSDGSTNVCTSGYPKPVWQTGTGVPADKVRDIPDLSLFASSGINASFYPICATDGDCQPVSSGDTVQVFAVGGTSASTPSFAGIMALINQKYGRQGQADFVLYPLAKQFPAAFHDVTNGTNSVPCAFSTTASDNTPNCISASNPITVTDPNLGTATEGQIGSGTTPLYNATAGYDLASGLGTVDANQMVTNWGNVKFASTGTTLTPSSTSFTHGTTITVSGSVTGTGTPTGNVALMTDSTEPGNQGQGFPVWFNGGESTFPLSNGSFSNNAVNYLPGGTYNIWGAYSGDSSNAASTSQKTQITVTPEASGIYLNVFNPSSSGLQGIPTGTTGIPYGTELVLSAQVAPSSKLSALESCSTSSAACPVFGSPTGVVTFSDNGKAINTAVLNTEGDAEYNPNDPVAARVMTNVGSHSITASYAGDASYNASTAAATTYTVVQATPQVNLSFAPDNITAGQTTTLTILVQSPGVGVAPTGTVSFSGNLPSGMATSAALSSSGVDLQNGTTSSYATVVVPATVTAGNLNLTVKYNGDTNYTTASASGTLAVVAASSLKASTTVLTVSSPATSPASLVGITVTVTGQGTLAPTGTVLIATSGYVFNPVTLVAVPGTDKSTASISVDSSGILQGANVLTAAYSGDSNYAASSSAAVTLANPLADFSIVPEATIVPVAAGASATDTINLASVNGFAGAVSFACATSTVTCTITSSATLASGGSNPLTLTINAGSSAASGSYDVLVTGKDSTGTFVHTLAIRAVVTNGSAPTPSFTLSSSPATLALTAGATTGNTSTVSVTPTGGFTGTVALTCAVTGPSGATSPATCGTLSPASVDITGTAAVTSVLTVTTTATTTPGSYTVTVTGTAGTTVETATVTVTVNASTPSTFALAPSPTTLSLTPGATSGNTSTITATPSGGFTGTVALTCSVASPSGATDPATCTVLPASVSITAGESAAPTATLTVNTTAPTTSALDLPLNKFYAVGGGIAVAGLLFFGIPARRRSWRTILGVLLFAGIVGMGIGCGGSGHSGGGGTTSGGTSAGTYTVTVTGTSGSLTETTTVTVTVN